MFGDTTCMQYSDTSQNEENEEMYLLTFAPNEDSNQPAHLRSLTRVFVVQNAPNEDSDQTVRMRSLI